MMVTTGGRGSSFDVGRRLEQLLLELVFLSAIGVWPNSSTTSVAVSWSIGWLIVAITPIFIIVLMTSLALIAMRLASSPTVIVSGICTSRLTGRRGLDEPVARLDLHLARAAVAALRLLLLLEARAGVGGDVQFLAAVLGRRARRRRARLGARLGGGTRGFGARGGSAARRSASARSRSRAFARLLLGGGARVGFGARARLFFQLAALLGLDALAFALLGGARLGLGALLLQARGSLGRRAPCRTLPGGGAALPRSPSGSGRSSSGVPRPRPCGRGPAWTRA